MEGKLDPILTKEGVISKNLQYFKATICVLWPMVHVPSILHAMDICGYGLIFLITTP